MRNVIIAVVAILAVWPTTGAARDAWGHHDCPGSVDADFESGSSFGVSGNNGTASNDDSTSRYDVVVDSRGGVSVSVDLGSGASPPNAYGHDEAVRTACDSARRHARGNVN